MVVAFNKHTGTGLAQELSSTHVMLQTMR